MQMFFVLFMFNSSQQSLIATIKACTRTLQRTPLLCGQIKWKFWPQGRSIAHFSQLDALGPFWGPRGRWGQTTSKPKMRKILNQNLSKLDEIQNLASATSKMTSWSQRPWNGPSEFFKSYIFKIRGSSWEKWAIARLSSQTFTNISF